MTYRSHCLGHRSRRRKRGVPLEKTFHVPPGLLDEWLDLVARESRPRRKRPFYAITLRLDHGLYHASGEIVFGETAGGGRPVVVTLDCLPMTFDEPVPLDRWARWQALRDGTVFHVGILIERGASVAFKSGIICGEDPSLEEVPYFRPARDWLAARDAFCKARGKAEGPFVVRATL